MNYKNYKERMFLSFIIGIVTTLILFSYTDININKKQINDGIELCKSNGGVDHYTWKSFNGTTVTCANMGVFTILF